MKRVLKSSLSLLLAITIILSSAYVGLSDVDFDGLFAVEAKAESTEENTVEIIEESEKIAESEDTTEDYVYYSELFYGYPYYLANDTYFQAYVGASNGIYNSVHESYQNSSLVIGTGIEHALDIVTSPTEIAKLITDTYGLTDFSYNDALDAANEVFVANMMSDTLAYSTQKAYGKVAKFNNQLNTMVTYFNKLNVTDTFGGTYTAEDVVYDAYNYLWDKGCLSFISEEMLFQLWEEISSDSFSLNSCFELAKNEIDIAMAIVTALMMENIRLELIEDVIALQTSDTVLKQGMVRLRDKLRGGFVSYFIENYLLKKLADDLFGVVDKVLVSGADAVANGSITSAELKALVAVAKKVFNYVVEVPKFDEVLKWQVLIAYSYDISETIKNKATSFTTGPFLSDEILKYENYFLLYDAVNKATMAVTSNIARMLDPFGNAYTVLEEARVNNISEVTITSGANSFPISSSTTEEELRAILIADTYVAAATGNVYALLKDVKISNGIRTEKITRKANGIGSVVRGCVSENIDLIYAFNQACSGVSLYEEHIKSAKTTILNTPILERRTVPKEVYSTWTYSVNNSIKLMEDSNVIETNCIYGLDNTILGNTEVFQKSTLKIPQDKEITVDGNIHVWSDNHLKNDGKLTVNGNMYVYWRCNFVNNNEMVINGSLDCDDSTSLSFINNGTIKTKDCLLDSYITFSTSADSVLHVSGNFTCKGTLLNGAVVFDGEKGQSISGLNVPIIIIDNSSDAGVIFNTAIAPSVLFNHNGNAFSLTSGSKFVDYDGDGMKDNIDPEPTVGNPCTITIATENVEKGTVSESFDSVGGTSVTVCAEPTFKYNFYCWKNASGSIVSYNSNYTFVAKGDTKLTAYFTKRQRNITVKTENGTLTVPSKAEIESTVTVTPVPNEGCLYTADSIIVNGEAITGNSFIMPDEDVTLSAHFCVNDYYFALKDVLTEAKEIDQTLYLTETVDVLQTAIENAQNSLVNEISQEESDARILELQTAMKNLILVTGTCGGSLTWSYDEESKTLIITGTGEMYDYTDSDSPWECLECKIQNVSISRGITSIGNAAFNNCSVLTDVYYGYTEENWNSLSIGTNNEYLISANIHCHVHNFLGTVTINATCIEDGEKTYNCDCGDVYIENIDALGHDYSTEWTIDVAVTCTEDGIKSHHCSRCAEKTDITVISATGHSYSDEWTIDVAPTCTQEGSKSHHCVNCEDYTDVTVVNALGHDYGDWNVTLEATCTVEGNKHKICLICDDTVSEVIPAKGHSYSTDWTIDVAPTCTEDGSKSHHCTGCDDMIDIIVIKATGHNISNDICISCGYGDVWGYELYADYAVITDYNGDKANVVIPDSIAGLPVRTIGNTVFDGYSNLVSITIPDSVTSIGSFTFRKCTNLISITIPDKMEKISSYAFYGCTGLTSIVVPKSLLNVGVSAFTKCSNLKYVFYTGAEPDWANIKISNNNSAFINAVVHFNSTGHNYVIQGAENIHPHTIAYKCSVCEDITEETPILSDCDECIEEIKGLVQETINAEIDYENFIIYTNVENCNDVTAFLSISESFVAVTEASYVYGNCEFYGTGTIITVFDGNEYVGDFTLVVNGDTNGDSVCDALDAAQVALVSNGQKDIDGAYKMAADSNSDDIVDIEDYQAIVNKVVA